MIERKWRKPYWRETKWQMFRVLLPFLGILAALPLYVDRLNNVRVLGSPLGYFLACHGIVILAIVMVALHVSRQDAIDHEHGANEDL
jgi:putative solute:sodium symporter small subunit